MDYAAHYQILMERSPKVKPKTGYFERHHIIPKCLDGSNERTNLVYLTPEEHYVAHQLLVKMHPGNKALTFALIAMTASSRNNDRSMNKLYGWARRQFSKTHSGVNHPMYGRKRPDTALRNKLNAGKPSNRKGMKQPETSGDNNPSKRTQVIAKIRASKIALHSRIQQTRGFHGRFANG